MVRLKTLKDQLVQLDEEEGTESWKAGLVLLASIVVGPNIKRIAKYTHIPRKEIIPMSKRLRENQVWVGSKVAAHEWFEKPGGGLSLILDGMVACGLLMKGTTGLSGTSGKSGMER